MLTIAVPKGRVLEPLAELFQEAGIDKRVLLSKSRKLVREDVEHDLRFILLKPDDVPTYVEYGAADLGVVGRDVLLEQDPDVYSLLDLGIARCRLAVAGKSVSDLTHWPLRVATKFQNATTAYFNKHGIAAEVIRVLGSVELAPLMDLAHVIVDLVDTGETLAQNGLRELAHIANISSVVIANRASLKLKQDVIRNLMTHLQRALPSP